MHVLAGVEVWFSGFRSNLAALLSAGWKLQSDFDPMQYGVHVAIGLEAYRLIGFLPSDSMMTPVRYGQGHVLEIKRIVSSDRTHVIMDHDLMGHRFKPLEIHPRFPTVDLITQQVPLGSLFQFEDPQELIIDAPQVDDLLKQIIELQRPVQAELRDKERRAVPKTHAKIISLAEYSR